MDYLKSQQNVGGVLLFRTNILFQDFKTVSKYSWKRFQLYLLKRASEVVECERTEENWIPTKSQKSFNHSVWQCKCWN